MAVDNKITFLIMATLESPNRWSRPFFVRAASTAEAYQEVLSNSMFQHPKVSLEAHIIDATMLPEMRPLLKAVARAYWYAGREAERTPNQNSTSFDDHWEENGIDVETES